jgi:uncharacterized membrane protein
VATMERSLFINAPVDAIEAIMLDGQRLPEWYAGIEQAEPDDVYPEPGGVVNMVYKAAGISFNLQMTSLELVRGQSGTYHMEGMIIGTNYWTFTPEGDGTWVTAKFEYEMPGGILGKAADKLVVERVNAQNLEQSLNNVKTLVET